MDHRLEDRFIEVLVESGALLTGSFQLKSGKTSPYFIDFGSVPDGFHLARLGECYADKIAEAIGLDSFDVIFGPAYKGIPIATAVVIAMQTKFNVSKRYAFNRKVPKSYGEGRQLLGGRIEPQDRVLIVDDVFSDGGAKLETLDLLRDGANPDVVHVIVGVDRSEPGARERFHEKSGGVPLTAICGMDDVQAAFASVPGAVKRSR